MLQRFAMLAALPLLFAASAQAADPVPVSALVARVEIPYERFTLSNGLRVLVHTDRKAPVVAVSIWYHVGSKDEPKGKTGFAHLFEHLMFNGSENAPGSVIGRFEQMGATDLNGSTWFDRTNYFETVPTAAFERTLFVEADRMGHLLGTIDRAALDNQRSVVQNEKRQDDNAPFGIVDYVVNDTLFPVNHPYRHATIGSMRDLNGASLEDVKNWFRAKYGPNNAVLVLAGDIDVASAKPLVEKWFGNIPRGPVVTHPAAPVPTLPAPVTKVVKDHVPYTRIMRVWAVEGVNGHDTAALQAAASVIGGLSSSRLDNALVRGDQSALNVSATDQTFENIGYFTIQADVKPGQDVAKVAERLDAIVGEFLQSGPTQDEVTRVATRSISGTIAGLESVGGFGGKAVALAEGQVYSGDPQKYKRDLEALAALTPEAVRAAAQKWLSRPVLAITVENGDRDTSPAMRIITGDARGQAVAGTLAGAGARGPEYYRKPGRAAPRAAHPASPTPKPEPIAAPPLGTFPPLTLPPIERARLSNGIPVYFARRSDAPTVRVSVSFDAGVAADSPNRFGAQALAMSLLNEGTTSRNSVQIAEAQERLGANLSTSSDLDRSAVGVYALSPNLAPSLELLADVVRNPAFALGEVERMRGRQLGGIAAELADPTAVARMMIPAYVYGSGHPYGRPATGLGSTTSVKAITRDDIIAFQRAWLRSDNAAIYAVGDTSLGELMPLLERSFGSWSPPATPKRVKDFTSAAAPRSATRIYLVDKPGTPQSVIRIGQALSLTDHDPAMLTLRQANDVLGGAFLSRLNMDLRESRGWSYGVGSAVSGSEKATMLIINAPVQSDKTGESVAVLLADMKAFLTEKGTTPEELGRTVNGAIRELPGSFETSDALLGGMRNIVRYGWPDDHYAKLGDIYQSLTATDMDKAIRSALDPAQLVIIVVGDAAIVRPQLDKLGLPVEAVTLPAAQ